MLPRQNNKKRPKVDPLKPATNVASPSVLGGFPDHILPHDLAHLNEGLRWLLCELREATELHRSSVHGGRAGALHAVKTMTAFLMLFDTVNKEGLQAPLALLADALKSLDSNMVEPMMKPLPHSGRAPASDARRSMKGVAAYVVRRLQDFGIDRATACKDVATQLAACDVKPDRGSGKMTARTIREWCDAGDADVGRRGDLAQTIDGLLADPQINNELDALTPKEARRRLLDRLASVARRTRANETK
jgi:hypothetical protein